MKTIWLTTDFNKFNRRPFDWQLFSTNLIENLSKKWKEFKKCPINNWNLIKSRLIDDWYEQLQSKINDWIGDNWYESLVSSTIRWTPSMIIIYSCEKLVVT